MRLYFCFLILIVGCASLSTRRLYSVEEVIRRSEWVKVVIEDEEDKEVREVTTEKKKLPRLQWPLKKVSVNSRFGKRWGNSHQGLDLKAIEGTPIFSAGAGTVLFVGDQIPGYGNTVVIKHNSEYSTLYAHASELIVKPGEKVKRGQCIGYAGSTGRASGAHLHFEIRKGTIAMNPSNWQGWDRSPSFITPPTPLEVPEATEEEL